MYQLRTPCELDAREICILYVSTTTTGLRSSSYKPCRNKLDLSNWLPIDFTFGQRSTSALQTSKETVLCYSIVII